MGLDTADRAYVDGLDAGLGDILDLGDEGGDGLGSGEGTGSILLRSNLTQNHPK